VTSNLRERNKKKPYQKPNLRVYGDVRALTQTSPSGKGNRDAVGKGAHKT
jgi:hypothetical protein